MTTATVSLGTIAKDLRSALARQESLYLRSSHVNSLLGQASGLFSRQDVQELAKRGAPEPFATKVDELAALQDDLAKMFADERSEVEQLVDQLTYALLESMDLKPRRSRYKHRRPAWVCELPHERYGKRTATVVSVSTVFLDKGELSALHLRVSEHDDGCTDSWTMGRRSGRLAVLETIDL